MEQQPDREPIQVPRTQVTVKTAAIVSAVALAAAGIAYLIVRGLTAITITVAAALIAVALNHGVERLQKWGFPRRWALLTVVAGVFAAIVALVAFVGPATVRQLGQLAERAPELWHNFRDSPFFAWANKNFHIDERIARLQQAKLGGGASTVKPVVGFARELARGIFAIVAVLFTVIFMLIYGGSLVRGILAETIPRHRERYELVLQNLYRSIGGYLSGLLIIHLLNVTVTSTFLAIVGVPFFIPLGILNGLGSFVPLIGVTVAGSVMALVALAEKGPATALMVISYVIVFQQLENHVFSPLVYKRTIRVNPLATLLGLIFMTELAGVVGAFLAVPLVAAGQIILHELLLIHRERLGLPLSGDVTQELQKRSRWKIKRRQPIG